MIGDNVTVGHNAIVHRRDFLLLQRGLLVQIVQLAGANRHVAHRVQHRLVVLLN